MVTGNLMISWWARCHYGAWKTEPSCGQATVSKHKLRSISAVTWSLPQMLVSSPPQRRAHRLRSGTRYTFGHSNIQANNLLGTLNTRLRSQREKQSQQTVATTICPHASEDGSQLRVCRKQHKPALSHVIIAWQTHKPTTCSAHTISTWDFGSAIVR